MMNNKNESNGNDKTNVSAGFTIPELDMPVGFDVSTPSRKKCPDGYYWVNTYSRGFWPFVSTVQGHCRKAGSLEKMQDAQFQSNLKMREMKEQYKLQKKEAKLRK